MSEGQGASTPRGWHPDPTGRYEFRWWDGLQWTENVSTNGEASIDPVSEAAEAGPTTEEGQLLSQSTLVINHKEMTFEVTNEYEVRDAQGNQIGEVRQINQSKANRALRVFGSWDRILVNELEVVDMLGSRLLHIKRAPKVKKPRFEISGPDREQVGEIVRDNRFGKPRFRLFSGGQAVGSINAEGWNVRSFSIRDGSDTEVARITIDAKGGKNIFIVPTTFYTVNIQQPIADPLRSLVMVSAVVVDTALRRSASDSQ